MALSATCIRRSRDDPAASVCARVAANGPDEGDALAGCIAEESDGHGRRESKVRSVPSEADNLDLSLRKLAQVFRTGELIAHF
jgi:hypothetical protein